MFSIFFYSAIPGKPLATNLQKRNDRIRYSLRERERERERERGGAETQRKERRERDGQKERERGESSYKLLICNLKEKNWSCG